MILKKHCLTAVAFAMAVLSCAATSPSVTSADSRIVTPVVRSTVFHCGENGYDTYRIPMIMTTGSGKLLAFAEARKHGRNDSGDIDLVAKISSDGGRNWGPLIMVWDDLDNTCGNPSAVLDRESGRIVLVGVWNKGTDIEKDIHNRLSSDTRRVFVLYSSDEGWNWSIPVEITSQVKDNEWTWYATGPCHAIQLTRGAHKGRMVVPCNHGVYERRECQGTVSHLIYSDDGGNSWHIGAIAQTGNESTVTELKDGRLLLNMRGQKDSLRVRSGYTRLCAISSDSGETLGPVFSAHGLVEPVCNGSVLTYIRKNGKYTGKVLFSGPRDISERKNMTISSSFDNGHTWKTAVTVNPGPSAYSDIVMLPGGEVGILYETGEEFRYERIDFLTFPADRF